MKIDDLLLAYKTIDEIMRQNNLTRNTSFISVKNFLSNMVCDNILKNNNDDNNSD